MAEHDGMIEYAAGDRRFSGFLALPVDDRNHAGVVVIQEWWGLDEHIRELAQRFAGAGYIALAPDLYNGRVTAEPGEARKLAMELEIDDAVAAMVGAVNYLAGREVTRTGAVGFCMGGSLALELAGNTPRLDAVVSFYGGRRLSAQQAEQIGCSVLLFFGGRDDGITPEWIAEMRATLDGAAVPNEVVVYPDAGHAFFNDTRARAYNAAAAQDAWRRTLEFFENELGGDE